MITGYDGYLGNNFCKFLKRKKISYKKLDVSKHFNRNFSNYSHIIHFQFFISNKKNSEISKKNLFVIKKISNLSLKYNIKIIFISSIAAKYNNNSYGKSKNLCEKYLKKNNNIKYFKPIILRVFNIYSDQLSKYGIVSDLVRRMKFKKKIILKNYLNKRDFIFYMDFYNLVFKCLNYKKEGVFQVGSGNSISIYSLSKKVKLIFNFSCKIVKSKISISKLNSYSLSSIKKTKKEFKWVPNVTLDMGLRRLMNNIT